MSNKPDIDPQETQEWLGSLEAVLENEGVDRAHFLLERLIDKVRRSGAYLPFSANTAYVNTLPVTRQERFPGNRAIEQRIRSFVRWNAMAMVVQANRLSTELGGHISSFASSATLYDIGFNHFFRARNEAFGGDLVFIQGHSAPGIYARAYLEGRLSEDQLYNFRQEVDGNGLSSYPHPWLMPNFWQFPTVSMGLGPIMSIYQARFMRYLADRGVVNTEGRKVWAFCGDGEMDEPESLGAISLPARERLDNLVLLSPHPDWVRGLPNAKLPDRSDFKRYADDRPGRVRAWQQAVAESQRLSDEFEAWLDGRIDLPLLPLR